MPADEEDGDEALLREMAEIKERMEERSKRDKKKARELKKKRKIRAAQTKVAEAGKKVEDDDLFDLKRIKTRAGVETVAGATVPEVRKKSRGWDGGEETGHSDVDRSAHGLHGQGAVTPFSGRHSNVYSMACLHDQ